MRTTHLHLEVEVDFQQRVLTGHVLLSMERVDPEATSAILDSWNLDILK